ncbi:MGMT family protein [Tessaracoccus terricola]
MDETLTELVLRAVELVPPGQLVSYGDVAALVGTGPRQVGAVMAREGHGVPWWRVTNASGDLPLHLMADAAPLWAAEGIVLKPNGRGARMRSYRADLERLASAFEQAAADIGPS